MTILVELVKIILHLLFEFKCVFSLEITTDKCNLVEFFIFIKLAPVFGKFLNITIFIAFNLEFFRFGFDVWQFKQIRNHCF